ncbi:hypothetical protein [Microcystis aeruginosa]|uniref:hypothetical protein n=1 Tax=Microcystis aeruginosa TaxID=1126 RepID=UPI001D134AB7|nr:hypothetical protein [Microcystis aeruginosa]
MKASNYQEIAKAAILAGGLAAAGVLSVGESTQAQFAASASQSRLSVAVTSILTEGNAAATNIAKNGLFRTLSIFKLLSVKGFSD